MAQVILYRGTDWVREQLRLALMVAQPTPDGDGSLMAHIVVGMNGEPEELMTVQAGDHVVAGGHRWRVVRIEKGHDDVPDRVILDEG